MLSTPPKGGGLFVEPLEQRIAPTNLVALANHPQDAGASNYVTYSTAPAAGKLGFVPAASYGVNGPANLFALALNGDGGTAVNNSGITVPTGDQLQIFTADGYRTFLQAVNGNLVAFFLDNNNDGQVQNTELVGISAGKKSVINVNGNVNGDIVTNLAKDGTITLNTAGNAKQSIAGLTISGNVAGSIASGGDIDSVTVNGSVNAILAGSAANGLAYHFGGITGAATGTVAFPGLADTKVGASVTNVSLFSIADRIQAGDGGGGGKGGNVIQLIVQGDSDGFRVLSGNGGGAGENLRGGAGGDILNVTVRGVPDATPRSTILIQAGHGGDNEVFKAGTGGSVSGIGTSLSAYDATTNTGTPATDLLADYVVVHAGDGGNGLRGGKGGSVSGSLLYGSITNDGITNADGTPNSEIQVLAGNGGINSAGGDGAKAGKGGSVNQIIAQNLNTLAAAQASSILIQGGNGGVVQADGNGRLGGDVNSIALLSGQVLVNAGNGSGGGAAGGNGGNLNDVTVLNALNLAAHAITLNGGSGGSSGGIGGTGGNINMIRVADSDLASLVINSGTHANGGVGGGGAGGAGGSVTDVQIADSGPFRAAAGAAVIRSGQGGNGAAGAGAGGSIDTFQLLVSDLSYNVTAGNGGSVLDGGRGKGGAGGALSNIGISNQPFDSANIQFAAGATGTLLAGSGGIGKGKGGAGGALTAVNLRATFDITLTAGAGGNSNIRRAGDGGSIIGSASSSIFGLVAAVAGNAGATGSVAAAGGSIDGFIAAAGTNITLTGGNGGVGGAGGSITNSGTSFNSATSQAQAGSLIVTAGRGSAANSVAGAGGSITNFNGFIGASGATAFTAGVGGGTGDSDVAGAGGSIDQVKLTGPGGTGAARVNITFDAGDAGDAGQAKRGVAGGSVTNVTLFSLSSTSVLQHIASGDGGDAAKRGGAGGGVNEIHVGLAGDATADIGIRSGVAYGYQTATGAGGIFVGLGGTGSKTNGAAGDVTNITANAIASIVAGKGAAPGLAGTVDHIFLNGQNATAPTVNRDGTPGNGSFSNFATANLVGSVQNPTAPGASTFRGGDGLIAAANVGTDRNFIPEAVLTLNGDTLVLVDYRQPAAGLVITPA